ncbi:MAG: hypothetical protein ACR2K5_10345 [Pseudolabrys sp.]
MIMPFRSQSEANILKASCENQMARPIEVRFGRSVRVIPDVEFDQILKVGFASQIDDGQLDEGAASGGFEEPAPFFDRPMIEFDLPLNFHPAAVRASADVTPSGAVSVLA